MERRVFDISWAGLWRVFLFVIFATVLFLGRRIVLALFLAVAISSGLEFIVSFLEDHRIPRTIGVILLFLLAFLMIIFVIYLLVPFAISDISDLLTNFSHSPLGIWFTPLLELKSQSFSDWATHLSNAILSGQAPPLGAFSGVVGSIGLAAAIVVTSFYLSLSPKGVERFIRAVWPQDSEEEAVRVYLRSLQKIGYWFRTQMALSFILGVLVWAVLFFLGVRHALVLGLLAGIFEIVPIVGPIIAGGAAIIFALTTSTQLALYTFLAFILIQQFESHVLVPVITKRTVGLHPVIVIMALLMGIELGGLLGAIVAVPAAAVFQEIVDSRSSRKMPTLPA